MSQGGPRPPGVAQTHVVAPDAQGCPWTPKMAHPMGWPHSPGAESNRLSGSQTLGCSQTPKGGPISLGCPPTLRGTPTPCPRPSGGPKTLGCPRRTPTPWGVPTDPEGPNTLGFPQSPLQYPHTPGCPPPQCLGGFPGHTHHPCRSPGPGVPRLSWLLFPPYHPELNQVADAGGQPSQTWCWHWALTPPGCAGHKPGQVPPRHWRGGPCYFWLLGKVAEPWHPGA